MIKFINQFVFSSFKEEVNNYIQNKRGGEIIITMITNKNNKLI